MPAPVQLELCAEVGLAEVVRFAAAQPWQVREPAHVDDLRLLLEELLSNVVRHAFAAHPAPSGQCRVEQLAEAAVISLQDNGPAFDPFDPANPPGQGLLLVRALARVLRQQHRAGCNQLELYLPRY